MVYWYNFFANLFIGRKQIFSDNAGWDGQYNIAKKLQGFLRNKKHLVRVACIAPLYGGIIALSLTLVKNVNNIILCVYSYGNTANGLYDL